MTYTPPGTIITEDFSPTITPSLAPYEDLVLVGPAQGYQTRTDQFKIENSSPVELPYLSSLPGSKLVSVVSVKDALDPSKGAANGSGYEVTHDYTVNAETNSITRVAEGNIELGTLVNVTYTYTPSTYFNAVRLYSLAEVENRFGSAYNAAGTAINSPLSFAAGFAFQNGAGSVICQPLFARATPGDPESAQVEPSATQIAEVSTWEDTLFVLRSIEGLNIISPVIGQSMEHVTDTVQLAVFTAVQNFQSYMRTQQEYIIAFFGEDSSTSSEVAQMSTIRAHAASLQGRFGGELNEQTVLINTSKFGTTLPGLSGKTIAVGGQYVAAAAAGALAARPVSSTLTRSAISGFTSVLDNRLISDKNTDAEDGLMVIEQFQGYIRCRHAITLDNTQGASRSEISVVRAKYLVIESIKNIIENNIVGKIIADGNSPFVVKSAISGVLSLLVGNKSIVSYGEITAQIASLEPTTIQASFTYRPAFPVNYVTVNFSLNLSTGSIEIENESAE